MQSFLQYHRFRKNVKAQYERDQEKARALNQYGEKSRSSSDGSPSGPSGFTDSPRSSLDSPSEDIRDPEKAEHSRRRGEEETIEPATSRTLSKLEGLTPTQERCESEMMSRVPTMVRRKSNGTMMEPTLTGIDVRDRTTREGGGPGKVFMVGYEGEKDQLNPHNWSFLVRISAT